jgi:tetratricopeptide (TPR) repeat protein
MMDEKSNADPLISIYQDSFDDTSKYRQFVAICEKLHRVSLTGLSEFHASIRGILDVSKGLLGDVTQHRMAEELEYDPRFAEPSLDDTPEPTEEFVADLSATIAELFAKGESLHGRGRYYNAIECFDKVIFVNPAHREAWNSKGLALDGVGRQAMAMGGAHQADGRLIIMQAIACFDRAGGRLAWLF